MFAILQDCLRKKIKYFWYFVSSKNIKIVFINTLLSILYLNPLMAKSSDDRLAPPAQGTGLSAAEEPLSGRNLDQDNYAGIVVNQTITVAGADFFQYFIVAWRDNERVDHYAISINERPTARFGSQIWINYGQNRVFQTFLPPARSALKSIALSAAEIVYQTVIEADVQRWLFRDPDLARDEF